MMVDGEIIYAKIQVTYFIARLSQRVSLYIIPHSPILKRLVSVYKLVAVESMHGRLFCIGDICHCV